MKRFLTNACILAAAAAAAGAARAASPSHWDGGRATPLHRLEMKDILGDTIAPEDPNALPVSTRNSCSLCHDYGLISGGWHFNAGGTNACPGRPGEPWFLIDPATGTQLPIGLRGWPGVYRPADIGMSAFDFVWRFGRNLPGGGLAEPQGDALMDGRWNVSGALEINCFACHDRSGLYDHSEYARQTLRQNFAWAAGAAMGWGDVEGMNERMPDYWGPLNGRNKDDSSFRVPAGIAYDPVQFDAKNRLPLRVGRPENANCLNCHGASQAGAPRMDIDGDVHLRAGMACADCHRNGEDHAISRGFERPGMSPAEKSLTCAGCHVADKAKAGRLGAPAPVHTGFPLVHFEKLACTVCHSGVTEGGEFAAVQTSRANRMGIYGRVKWLTDAPYIREPVFVKNPATGKIEPRRIAWPAFWGARSEDGSVRPLPPGLVEKKAGRALSAMKDVGAVLAMLESDPNFAARGERPVLSRGGRLFRVNIDGIPVPFQGPACPDGLFYVKDPALKTAPKAPLPPPPPNRLADLAKAALQKAAPPAAKPPYTSVVPENFDPDYNADAAAAKKLAEPALAAAARDIARALAADEKDDLDKMSPADRKTRLEEIDAEARDELLAQIQQGLAEAQDAKKTRLENLLTTVEASAFYADAMVVTDGMPFRRIAGAAVTSGRIFFRDRGETAVESRPAPAGAAPRDIGLYDLAAKTFTSFLDASAAGRAAELAGTPFRLTEGMVAEALGRLAAAGVAKPVYVGRGRVWELDAAGALAAAPGRAAEPVTWALAHDVRPARMARGARPVKCADCHTPGSSFFFGKIVSSGPLLTARPLVRAQNEFMGAPAAYNRLFGSMFLVRPLFKIFLWAVFAALALAAVAFTAAAVPVFLRRGGIPYGRPSEKFMLLANRLSGLAAGCCGAYLGISGAYGWCTGGMTGWPLVLHQVAGGIFAAALLALIWLRGAARIDTKRAFWWMLALCLAGTAVFTAVAPMMTVFGSGWQLVLLWAHRCSAFCFLAVAAWMLLSGGRKE